MIKRFRSGFVISLFIVVFMPGCMNNVDNNAIKEIQIMEGEKWWGGAVLDGRNMPFSGVELCL